MEKRTRRQIPERGRGKSAERGLEPTAKDLGFAFLFPKTWLPWQMVSCGVGVRRRGN